MTRKSITTVRDAVACDVCGRTLLRGEHADPFIAGGSRRMVCELCTARASNEGWIREGADDALGVRRNGTRGGARSLLGRLRPQRRAAPPVELPYSGAPTNVSRVERAATAGAEEGAAEARAHARGARRGARLIRPGAPGRAAREPRHVHAVPTNADLKVARAVEVFNASAHPRRIAGVARSLGEPTVSVRPSQLEGAIVAIAVSWELCWYRYEVDLADEAAGVRVTGQGAERSELSEGDRSANAVADEHGRLVVAAPPPAD